MPTYSETLVFHFGLPDQDHEHSEAFSRAFHKALGLKTFSGCWSEIALNAPDIDRFITEVRRHKASGWADFIGLCSVTQSRPPTPDEYEWYEISTQDSLYDFMDWYECEGVGLPSIEAFKVNPRLDVGHGGLYNVFVSERFRSAVEELHLSGIEFLWLKDTGKYQASQWYIPVATCPLGKGVDHPWFDPTTLRGADSAQPFAGPFRTGVNHFQSDQIRADARIDSPQWREILPLFDENKLTIIHAQVLEEVLAIDRFRLPLA